MPIETLINAVKHWAERTFATRGEVDAAVESATSTFATHDDVDAAVEANAPDWNAAEGEPGQIKNKPFGQEEVTQKTILQEISVTTEKYAIYPSPMANVWLEEPFVAGAVYHVMFDGETYTCVCRLDEGFGNLYVGNGEYDNITGGNGEPFCLRCTENMTSALLYTENEATHTVSAAVEELGYTTIPEMYIPANMRVGRLGESGEIFNNYEDNESSGEHSHAEGSYTKASAYTAHAEGNWTEASGDSSHAEGDSTIANGNCSHAEGYGPSALGSFSHAEGYYTTAASDGQHVQGRYNVVDSERVYAHIVGNGRNQSLAANIHALDWLGNGWFSGNLYVGGTSKEDAFPVGFVTHTETYAFDGSTSGRDKFTLNGCDFYKVAEAPDVKTVVDWSVTKVASVESDAFDNTVSIFMDDGRARCLGRYVYIVSVSGTVKLSTIKDLSSTYSVNVTSPGVYVMWDSLKYERVTELKLTTGTPMVEVVSALESRITALEAALAAQTN